MGGETETGDRAEIADLPEDLPFWGEIAATSENCIGTECPRYTDCFVTRMRSRAAESNLVVVNHHLLCADAAVRQSAYGEVIPECNYAIVDEAHQLEDVATQYFGVSVSNYRFEELARDGERLNRYRRRRRKRAWIYATALDRVRRSRTEASRAPATRRSRRRERGTRHSRRSSRSMRSRLADGALDQLEATAALIKPPSGRSRAPRRTRSWTFGARHRAGELRDELRFVLKANEPDYVYFRRRGAGESFFVRLRSTSPTSSATCCSIA